MKHPEEHPPWPRACLIVLAAVAILRLIVAATTGIVEDEAYYWVWSRNLAAGYYDHPPGVAWFIAASERIFGATSLGVRGAGVVAGVLGAGLLVRLARDRWLMVALLGGLPLYTLGGVLATPDVPLLTGWAIALYGAATGRWWLAGLGGGLAGLGKYTGWGLWPLLIAWKPTAWRGWLPGVLISLLCWAPNLGWNLSHDWISVKFQFAHGLQGATAPGLNGLLAYVGAQVGLVSPILFGAMVVWWAVGWRGDDIDRLCWWTSLPAFVFFGLASTQAQGEANWPAMAWFGGCLGLARATGRIARAAWVGAGLGILLSALILLHLYVPLIDSPRDPTARLGLGRTLAESVQAWGVEPIYTTRYQEAALLSYYAGLEAYALPGVDRIDQYDLWPVRWSERALFVRPYKSGLTLSSDPFCPDHSGANVVTERDATGAPLQRWQVYEVFGCQPQ